MIHIIIWFTFLFIILSSDRFVVKVISFKKLAWYSMYNLYIILFFYLSNSAFILQVHVDAHCGIAGNEAADKLANQGAKLPLPE